MINKVLLIGNLGKDPEFKTTESGIVRAHLVIATNDTYKDKSGQIQKKTEWHDVVVWRALAEKARVLRKGMLVYIEGKLSHRKWTDKEGKDHYGTEISVDTLRILEKRENSGGHSQKKDEHRDVSDEIHEEGLHESDEPGY
ncbi:MAG: single-stranded DNA-binding protein [Saprospiraceae bacterium]|nr:single-stranded DNA-binding protein [Saprospiraceae bacterium]